MSETFAEHAIVISPLAWQHAVQIEPPAEHVGSLIARLRHLLCTVYETHQLNPQTAVVLFKLTRSASLGHPQFQRPLSLRLTQLQQPGEPRMLLISRLDEPGFGQLDR